MTADVGIIGASGYTGSELTRILSRHPDVNLEMITSRSHAGKRISDLHPYLRSICDMELTDPSMDRVRDLDLVFLALPHGISMDFVKEITLGGPRIIDLSGDFRLESRETYERWYGIKHSYPEAIGKAAYGLPELFREEIKRARLVANPGCYPTSVILPLSPVVQEGLVDRTSITVDSKSGVTGAGAKPNEVTHYPGANEDLRAYKIGTHRHTPEMEGVLSRISGEDVDILFIPHLVPLSRGILSTVYCRVTGDVTEEMLDSIYEDHYGNEPFIRLRGSPPRVQAVRGSNYCDIHHKLIVDKGLIVAVSVIDNLVKGASGQAVQNMNLMLGYDEGTGISQVPISP